MPTIHCAYWRNAKRQAIHEIQVELVAPAELVDRDLRVVYSIELIRQRLEERKVLVEASGVERVDEVDHLRLRPGAPQRRDEKEHSATARIGGSHGAEKASSMAPSSM